MSEKIEGPLVLKEATSLVIVRPLYIMIVFPLKELSVTFAYCKNDGWKYVG